MVVPLSIGPSDFLAAVQLSWRVYKACKNGGKSFQNIKQEVASLYMLLKEGEEILFDRELPNARQTSLRMSYVACKSVLEDLQDLLRRYQGLSLSHRHIWDSLKWDTVDLKELRLRMGNCRDALQHDINRSERFVEQQLQTNLAQASRPAHEASISASYHTAQSLTNEEQKRWRIIRDYLTEIGLTIAAVQENKQFIQNWFQEASASGAFDQRVSEAPQVQRPSPTDTMWPSIDIAVGADLPRGHEIACQQSARTGPPLPDVVEPQLETPTDNTTPWQEGASVSNESAENFAEATLALNLESIARRRSATRLEALLIGRNPRKEFINACKLGEIELVRGILCDQAKTSRLDKKYLSLGLCIAVEKGNDEVVNALLTNNADPETKDIHGATLLLIACFHEHLAIVEMLLGKGANPNGRGNIFNFHQHALHESYGRKEEFMTKFIERLFKNNFIGKHVFHRPEAEYCPLHVASYRGNLPIVLQLLQNGADKDALGANKETPLMVATVTRHADITLTLLEKGAKTGCKDIFDGSSFCTAVHKGADDIVRQLLRYGAEMNPEKDDSYSPLVTAAGEGYGQIVRLLLENGARVDTRGCSFLPPLKHVGLLGALYDFTAVVAPMYGPMNPRFAVEDTVLQNIWDQLEIYINNCVRMMPKMFSSYEEGFSSRPIRTALMAASCSGFNHVVQQLLNDGAEVDATISASGETALILASSSAHEKVVDTLLTAGANPNAGSPYGSTALISASTAGNETIVRTLLEHGAYVHAVNNRGETALQAASARGCQGVVEVLRQYGAVDPVFENNLRTVKSVSQETFQSLSRQSSGGLKDGNVDVTGTPNT